MGLPCSTLTNRHTSIMIGHRPGDDITEEELLRDALGKRGYEKLESAGVTSLGDLADLSSEEIHNLPITAKMAKGLMAYMIACHRNQFIRAEQENIRHIRESANSFSFKFRDIEDEMRNLELAIWELKQSLRLV